MRIRYILPGHTSIDPDRKYFSIQKYAERQNTFAYTQYIIIIVMRAKQHKRIPLGVRLKMPGLLLCLCSIMNSSIKFFTFLHWNVFPMWVYVHGVPWRYARRFLRITLKQLYYYLVTVRRVIQIDPPPLFLSLCIRYLTYVFFVFTLILDHRLNLLHLDTKTTIPDHVVHILCFFLDFPIQ